MGNDTSKSSEELSWMENSECEEEENVPNSVQDTSISVEEEEDHGGVVPKSSKSLEAIQIQDQVELELYQPISSGYTTQSEKQARRRRKQMGVLGKFRLYTPSESRGLDIT